MHPSRLCYLWPQLLHNCIKSLQSVWMFNLELQSWQERREYTWHYIWNQRKKIPKLCLTSQEGDLLKLPAPISCHVFCCTLLLTAEATVPFLWCVWRHVPFTKTVGTLEDEVVKTWSNLCITIMHKLPRNCCLTRYFFFSYVFPKGISALHALHKFVITSNLTLVTALCLLKFELQLQLMALLKPMVDWHDTNTKGERVKVWEKGHKVSHYKVCEHKCLLINNVCFHFRCELCVKKCCFLVETRNFYWKRSTAERETKQKLKLLTSKWFQTWLKSYLTLGYMAD